MKKALVTILAVLVVSGLASAATRTATFDGGSSDGWSIIGEWGNGVWGTPEAGNVDADQNIKTAEFKADGSGAFLEFASQPLESNMSPEAMMADLNVNLAPTTALAASGRVTQGGQSPSNCTLSAGWFNETGALGLWQWSYAGYSQWSVGYGNRNGGGYGDLATFVNVGGANLTVDFDLSYDPTTNTISVVLTDVNGNVLTTISDNGGLVQTSGNLTGFGFGDAYINSANSMYDTISTQLDDVTYTVPEPATMTLLGLGGLGVLARRRRA